MVIGVHQPHYMPWLGYLDKMAKSDVFVIYDRVQFEKSSPMCRNRILMRDGNTDFITVGYEKHGLMQKEGRFVESKDWPTIRERHLRQINDAYVDTHFFKEIFPLVEKSLEVEGRYMIDIQMATVNLMRKMFGIKTQLVLQSGLEYDMDETTASTRLISVIRAAAERCHPDERIVYLSGNGARKYNDIPAFTEKGIDVVYQQFNCPEYQQKNASVFVPNLSALDILFNCGIDESRRIFWQNVHSTNEF